MGNDTEKSPTSGDLRETIFQITEKYLQKYYHIRFNEISNDAQFKFIEEKEYRELNIESLYIQLQNKFISISMPKLLALLKSGFMENYNPFKAYFERVSTIACESGADHIEKLAGYISARQQERFNRYFKKMLVRSVACSLNDSIVNKQAFILVHDRQNSGKSTFLRWLCPGELQGYYTENIGLDKDSLIALSENFIINLDELAVFSKVEINSLKSILSKANIKVRRPFERKAVVTPRRANFVGSTNKMEFLSDESGSVRWLCFEIEKINWNYSKEIDIDKIWGQAYNLYKSEFHYELTAQEIEENEAENKRHQRLTIEMELIQRYYVPATKISHDVFYTASDFMFNLNERVGMQLKSNVENMGKALKTLGFEQDGKYNGRHTIKGYYVKFNIDSDLTQLLEPMKEIENELFILSK